MLAYAYKVSLYNSVILDLNQFMYHLHTLRQLYYSILHNENKYRFFQVHATNCSNITIKIYSWFLQLEFVISNRFLKKLKFRIFLNNKIDISIID